MKNQVVFFLLLTCVGLESCKKDVETTKVQDEKPISVVCYKAMYEKDTIDLKINILKGDKITGNMEMKIIDMPVRKGKIVGEFRGDTLFVDYSFSQGPNDRKVFKNPMAMLKKGNELILGNGKIETYLGRSYFAKDTPIDFEKVKYKFTTVDCIDK
jgi:hypothetical protein